MPDPERWLESAQAVFAGAQLGCDGMSIDLPFLDEDGADVN